MTCIPALAQRQRTDYGNALTKRGHTCRDTLTLSVSVATRAVPLLATCTCHQRSPRFPLLSCLPTRPTHPRTSGGTRALSRACSIAGLSLRRLEAMHAGDAEEEFQEALPAVAAACLDRCCPSVALAAPSSPTDPTRQRCIHGEHRDTLASRCTSIAMHEHRTKKYTSMAVPQCVHGREDTEQLGRRGRGRIAVWARSMGCAQGAVACQDGCSVTRGETGH